MRSGSEDGEVVEQPAFVQRSPVPDIFSGLEFALGGGVQIGEED